MKAIATKNIPNATITSSTENATYDFDTALNDSRLSRVGRTTSKSSQWIKFAFNDTITFDTIGIFNNNFTPNATVKIQGSRTDDFTTPMYSYDLIYTKDTKKSHDMGRDVGVWTYQFSDSHPFTETIDDYNDLPILDNNNLSLQGSLEVPYWRLFISDLTNPDGYLSIGFIFLDMSVDFPGMSVNQVFKRVSTSEPNFSTSGQLYGLERLQYNEASFSFSSVTDTQKKLIEDFFDEVDIVDPFMLLTWENSLDIQRPLYVVNTSTPEFKRLETSGGVMWNFNNSVKECF